MSEKEALDFRPGKSPIAKGILRHTRWLKERAARYDEAVETYKAGLKLAPEDL